MRSQRIQLHPRPAEHGVYSDFINFREPAFRSVALHLAARPQRNPYNKTEEANTLAQAQPQIPNRIPLREALAPAGIFAALTFLIHLGTSLWGSHLGYGFFRDELYFLVCGHHLAWGYVDQPPMVALQARLAELLFGISPTGDRIFSFLAGGITVGAYRAACLAAWRTAARANPGHDRHPRRSGFPWNRELSLDELL